LTTTLVTGATDGIGKETARQLLARGHEVILHGRNAARLEATRAALSQALPNARLQTVQGDLASLASVRELAARVPDIDVLVNNAGIYANEPSLTVDGFESTFAVNHLAPFLLTHLLLARLRPGGRVVNVSSVAHTRGKLAPRTWRSLVGYDDYAAYAESKLANVLFTVELARRLPTGLTTYALHPGVVSTKLLTEGFRMRGSDSLAAGAETSVYLASEPGIEAHSGQYFVRKRPAKAHALAGDAAATRDFYVECAALVGIDPLEAR